MKALILAAGFGTRLLPYTHDLPKPLFTINNQPVLAHAVNALLDAGCTRIFINTHHLAGAIADFVETHPARAHLSVVFEPVILDTGGAIANLGSDLCDDDFLVVNADVICDYDLSHLMACHKASDALATLLVHDCDRFNTLCVDQTMPGPGIVRHFSQTRESGLAFTGIQAVSPDIFTHMPSEKIFSSIDVYKKLCPQQKIFAIKATRFYWRDMGTSQDYRHTARECLAGKIFGIPPSRIHEIGIQAIAGDGSDRLWFRARHQGKRVILADHGICIGPDADNEAAQLNAFIKIGNHLADKGVAVPSVLGHDTLSGQVAVADLGSTHLADRIQGADEHEIIIWYQRVIEALIDFSFRGIVDFNPAWCCQTPAYTKQMILDLECRYFMEAFVNGYLGRTETLDDFARQFSRIADNAVSGQTMPGLMHRDCQSRNIMIHEGHPWFIDFQSARPGPIQYDLASLFIDPYVMLPRTVRDRLLTFALEKIDHHAPVDRDAFLHTFRYCTISRNLQMLGAFGFLTRIKKKPRFETYIPVALTELERGLNTLNDPELADLTRFIQHLQQALTACQEEGEQE